MANIIKREKVKSGKKPTVYVSKNATVEELEEVNRLVSLGWISKPMKDKKPEVIHTITKDFNIHYDEATKNDMVKFIKEFFPETLKNFAVESHKNSKGEVIYTTIKNEGKPDTKKAKYFHITAKNYFYQTYFPERWKNEIKPMLDERNFKNRKKNEANVLEDELQELLG